MSLRIKFFKQTVLFEKCTNLGIVLIHLPGRFYCYLYIVEIHNLDWNKTRQITLSKSGPRSVFLGIKALCKSALHNALMTKAFIPVWQRIPGVFRELEQAICEYVNFMHVI